jgi:hypothetical protein
VKVVGKIIGRLILAVPLLVLSCWMLYASIEAVSRSSDTNGDGIFTISDLPKYVFDIIIAPGDKYQDMFSKTSVGIFLEMSSVDQSVFWSLAFTAFTYFIFFFGIYALFGGLEEADGIPDE